MEAIGEAPMSDEFGDLSEDLRGSVFDAVQHDSQLKHYDPSPEPKMGRQSPMPVGLYKK